MNSVFVIDPFLVCPARLRNRRTDEVTWDIGTEKLVTLHTQKLREVPARLKKILLVPEGSHIYAFPASRALNNRDTSCK